MLKKYLLATLSPSPTAYFSILQREEAAFWQRKCQGSVWSFAWDYRQPKGIWYLVKLIFIRMIMPYVIVGGALLAIICVLVTVVMYCYTHT